MNWVYFSIILCMLKKYEVQSQASLSDSLQSFCITYEHMSLQITPWMAKCRTSWKLSCPCPFIAADGELFQKGLSCRLL